MTKFNKLLLGAVALYAFSLLTFSHAEEGNSYVSGSVGIGKTIGFINKDKDYDEGKISKGNIYGVAVGRSFTPNLRAELTANFFRELRYSHEENGIKQSQSFSSDAIFANMYFDIKEVNSFTPYVGLGIGLAKNETGNLLSKEEKENDTVIYGKSKTNFAWQFGAGISYNLNEKITLDILNYKYYNLGSITTAKDDRLPGDGTLKNKLKIHSFSTGIRLKF